MQATAKENSIPRRDWARAYRIVKSVIVDPTKTDEVIEIIDALAGPSFVKNFGRWAAEPAGRELLEARPNLLAKLVDREALAAMPEGSFGQVYADFMRRGGISPEGLTQASKEAREQTIEALSGKYVYTPDPDREYFGARLRDQHDLWHVLTGYGMAPAGEAANLAFSISQIPNMGMAFLVAATVFLAAPKVKFRWSRYLIQAWRRGRAVPKMLHLARHEELLPLPLEEVRKRLGIPPQEEFHPDGVAIMVSRTPKTQEIIWKFTNEPAVMTSA